MKKLLMAILLHTILINATFSQYGKQIKFSSSNAMFPDTARAKGHLYDGKLYDAPTHYSDSSVLLYVPEHFSPKKKIQLVFWFHGWGNNIDTACKQFQLIEQFEASKRNAVFVFPEGPKNAPDSYGGKLEQPNVFQELVKEIVQQLQKIKAIKNKKDFDINDYDITLAGHSGAYRVISRIINQSPINEVILFDAMYGGNDAYLQWIAEPSHRFLNIYTKDGGTFDNCHYIIQKLTDSLHVKLVSVDEDVVDEKFLRSNEKIFMFSKQAHNDVILYQRNWERFLKYSTSQIK
jgi:predicted esterase